MSADAAPSPGPRRFDRLELAGSFGDLGTFLPIVVALRAATKRPLWVKPNAGMPDLEDGRPVWRQTPEEFGGFVPQLIEAGANVLGGCCGSGPEHIHRVAAIVKKSKGRSQK